jgi:hypothetical protein
MSVSHSDIIMGPSREFSMHVNFGVLNSTHHSRTNAIYMHQMQCCSNKSGPLVNGLPIGLDECSASAPGVLDFYSVFQSSKYLIV